MRRDWEEFPLRTDYEDFLMDTMDWVHYRSPSIATQNGILCADDLTIKVQRRVHLKLPINDTKKTTSDESRPNRRKPKVASPKTQNLTPCFIDTLEALL